jgi:AraC-like DNA-binding protein
MPVETPFHISHYGHENELAVGDFVLTDSSMPLRTAFARPNVSLAFMIPYATLARYLPDPEASFGRVVTDTNAFSRVVGTTVGAIWSHTQTGSHEECAPNFARSLLESIAAACALEHRSGVAESCVANTRRTQIKRFIEKHLRDTGLNAHSVAAGLRLSARYTRMLFATEGEGIAEYILRRRLEECANQLTDSLWLGHSITETAFAWGFSSTAHFTRAFKERFTLTPSEYRRNRAREPVFTT